MIVHWSGRWQRLAQDQVRREGTLAGCPVWVAIGATGIRCSSMRYRYQVTIERAPGDQRTAAAYCSEWADAKASAIEALHALLRQR